MAAFRVRAPYSRHPLQVVPARGEPMADLLDPLEAVHSVRFGVFLLVVLAEVGKVAIEYRVKLVAVSWNVLTNGGRSGIVSER